MTETITIPTPPPWVDFDAIIPIEMRQTAFRLVGVLTSAGPTALSVEVLEEARATLRLIYATETPALAAVNTAGVDDGAHVSDGAFAFVAGYSGSQALHNAMCDYAIAHGIQDGRYDPEAFMTPTAIKSEETAS